MKEEEIRREKEERLAQFKFHLIAPALFSSHGFESDKAYFRSIAGKEYCLPDGSFSHFSVETLARWLRNYRKSGAGGLHPAPRKDKGKPRKLSEKAARRTRELVQAVPRATAAAVRARLLKEQVIKHGEVSTDTVRRYIEANHLRSVPEEPEKLRNSFLVPHAGNLYVADTCYFEKIQEKKGRKKPWVYVQGIIDDHSRLELVTNCVTHDDALNFQMTLREAVSIYGIPERLYVDLGSAYNNADLVRICNELGIQLIHTHARDGAAKGVIENKWKLIQQDTAVDIVVDRLDTYEQIAQRVEEWRNEYNGRYNSGVGGVPVERWNTSVREKPLRKVGSEEELSRAFSHHRHRKLTPLGTVSLNNVKYKVPDSLRTQVKPGTRLEIVYDPKDMKGTIHMIWNGDSYPLKEDDPVENAAENAAEALKKHRENRSCTGMTAEEIRAENRYRKRMAGTGRTDPAAEEEARKSVAVPETALQNEELIPFTYEQGGELWKP